MLDGWLQLKADACFHHPQTLSDLPSISVLVPCLCPNIIYTFVFFVQSQFFGLSILRLKPLETDITAVHFALMHNRTIPTTSRITGETSTKKHTTWNSPYSAISIIINHRITPDRYWISAPILRNVSALFFFFRYWKTHQAVHMGRTWKANALRCCLLFWFLFTKNNKK